jgi:hypothetical protein
VVLTGQDGFSPDQARGFAPTPQEFLFGVCATASNDPHCTVDPNTVPKALDVVTPSGVSQSQELDYTVNNPVTIQGCSFRSTAAALHWPRQGQSQAARGWSRNWPWPAGTPSASSMSACGRLPAAAVLGRQHHHGQGVPELGGLASRVVCVCWWSGGRS